MRHESKPIELYQQGDISFLNGIAENVMVGDYPAWWFPTESKNVSTIAMEIGQEMGAKYMLQGEIQSIEDGAGREKVVYYQIDATLVDLESNVKVWAGQHKIKKYIERARFGL
mgnify:CR=1 FL=1